MAEEIRKIISVETKDAENNVKNLANSFKSIKEAKAYIDSATASLVGMDEESEEYAKTVKDVQTVQNSLNNALKNVKGAAGAASGSYADLAQQMSKLKQEWKNTGDAMERASLGKKINDINNQLKGMDASIGNYQRNVGNYGSAFTQALTAQVPAIGKVNTALKGLSANPIGAAVTALVAIFMALKKGIESSEERSNKFNATMARLKPVMAMINNVIGVLVDWFLKLVDVLTKAVEGITRFVAKVAEFLGMDSLSSKISGMADSMDEYAQAEEKHNQAMIEARDNEQKISELESDRAKVLKELATNDKLTYEQKADLVEQAKSKLDEQYQLEKKMAQEELDYLQKQAKLTSNSTAENEKLAAAKKKVSDLDRDYNNNVRSLERQTSRYLSTTSSGSSGVKKQLDEVIAGIDQLIQRTPKQKSWFTQTNEYFTNLAEKINGMGKGLTSITAQLNSDVKTINSDGNDAFNKYASKFNSLTMNLQSGFIRVESIMKATNGASEEIQKQFSKIVDDVIELTTEMNATKINDSNIDGYAQRITELEKKYKSFLKNLSGQSIAQVFGDELKMLADRIVETNKKYEEAANTLEEENNQFQKRLEESEKQYLARRVKLREKQIEELKKYYNDLTLVAEEAAKKIGQENIQFLEGGDNSIITAIGEFKEGMDEYQNMLKTINLFKTNAEAAVSFNVEIDTSKLNDEIKEMQSQAGTYANNLKKQLSTVFSDTLLKDLQNVGKEGKDAIKQLVDEVIKMAEFDESGAIKNWEKIIEKVDEYRDKLQDIDLNNSLTKMFEEDTQAITESVNADFDEWFEEWMEKRAQARKDDIDYLSTLPKELSGMFKDTGDIFSSIIDGDIEGAVGQVDGLISTIKTFQDALKEAEEIGGSIDWASMFDWKSISEGAGQAMMGITNMVTSAIALRRDWLDAELEAGDIQQEEYEKKMKETQNIEYVNTIIQGLSGAVAAFASAMQLGWPMGPIIGGAMSTAMIAMSVVNANLIKKMNKNSSGGSISTGAASYTPSVTQVDQATVNKLSEATGQSVSSAQQDVRVYVVESDITEAQNNVKVAVDNSQF